MGLSPSPILLAAPTRRALDLSPGYVDQGDPLRAFDDNGWVVGGSKAEDLQRFDTATEDGLLPPWDVAGGGAAAGSVNGSVPSSICPAISPHLDFDEFLSRQSGFLAHKESRYVAEA